MPVLVATAKRPEESENDATRTPVMRGSPARTIRSSSRASSILRSAGRAATAGSKASNGTGATPSGSASPTHSSGSANAALSRASARASATTSSSRLPAHAKPCRWSCTTRTPMPAVVALVKDSTSAAWTLTVVYPERPTNASICSSGPARPATPAATARRSAHSPSGGSLTERSTAVTSPTG